MKSNLIIFSLVAFAFGVISQKPLPNPGSRMYPLSSKTSIVSPLTFQSSFHFDLIFLYGMILLHMDSSLSQHHLFNITFFLTFFPPLFTINPNTYINSACGCARHIRLWSIQFTIRTCLPFGSYI